MHTLRNLEREKIALKLFKLQLKISVSHTVLFNFLLLIRSKKYKKDH